MPYKDRERQREAERKAQAKRQYTMRMFIREAKNKPCADCGQRYPHYVMDFDHCEGEKLRNISKMQSYGLERVKLEIAKCEVVCANCHRIRTNTRGE